MDSHGANAVGARKGQAYTTAPSRDESFFGATTARKARAYADLGRDMNPRTVSAGFWE